jgi:single-strand DNA-binding protein
MSTSITIAGNITEDQPRFNFTREGTPAANFTVADNSWRRDSDSGEWQQTDATFWPVAVFGGQAERVAEQVSKGDRVIVTGRVQTHQWTDQDGNRRRELRIRADEIAQSLKFGPRNDRAEPAEVADN